MDLVWSGRKRVLFCRLFYIFFCCAEAPQVTKVSTAPQASKAPQVSKEPQAGKASQVSKAPQAGKAPQVSKAP